MSLQHVSEDHDGEKTIVDHGARHAALASLKTELMDPSDLLVGQETASPTSAPSEAGGLSSIPESNERPPWRHAVHRSSPWIAIACFTLACVLAGLAHHERKRTEALQAAILELKDTTSAKPEKSVLSTSRLLQDSYDRAHRTKPDSPHVAEDLGSLERRGADLLAAHEHDDALAHYRTLAEAFPAKQVFFDLVQVLERKRRCATSKHASGSTQCR